MVSGISTGCERDDEEPCQCTTKVRDARGVHGAASGNGGSLGTARSYTVDAPCTAQKTVAPRRIRGGKSEGPEGKSE